MDEQNTALAQIEKFVRWQHDCAIALHHRIFFELPPDDDGCYAYTYYDGNGYPLYHGYTSSARQRAKEHWTAAPWAGWAEDVRYRKCSTPAAARRLEVRLQKKVPSLGEASGRTHSYHGQDWSGIEREFRVTHVGESCKLPGGLCDVEHWAELWKAELG